MKSKVKVHEDYTIEIGGVCIEYLKREDIIKLRDELNKILGDEIDLSKITFPQIPYSPMPTMPDPIWVGDGTSVGSPIPPTVTWCGNTTTLENLTIHANVRSES